MTVTSGGTMTKILVWHKFWRGGIEERGVSRIFPDMKSAKEWAANNIGNWQFEVIQ